jgi:hypothetical protein
MHAEKHKKIIYILLVLSIFFFAGFVRFYKIDKYPPGLFHDTAYNGTDARLANKTGDYKIFYPANFGREGLFINLVALSFKLFGDGIGSIMAVGAVIGFATIIGFYLLLRSFGFSRYSTILSVFMLSSSFWHLNFSRSGIRCIFLPFILVWSGFFFLKGIRKIENASWNMLAGGIILGLGFHTYVPARIAPLIFLAVIAGLIRYKPGFFESNWKKIFIFFISGLVVALPMIFYSLKNPDDYWHRTKEMSVFMSKNPPMLIGESIVRSLGLIAFGGEENPRHSYSGKPLLPFAWLVLFLCGFILSMQILRNRKRPAQFSIGSRIELMIFAQVVFWIMLIPAILTVETSPSSMRMLGMLPAVFIFIALALDFFWQFMPHPIVAISEIMPKFYKYKRIIMSALAILVAVRGFWQVKIYFVDFPRDQKTRLAFDEPFFELGKTLPVLPKKQNNLILVNWFKNDDLNRRLNFETANFVSRGKLADYDLIYPDSSGKIDCSGSQVIFMQEKEQDKEKILQICPQFKASYLDPGGDGNKFLVLK